jgi:hypothetical protein
MMKSRRMRWSGYVVGMGKRNAYRALVGKPEGRDHWEYLEVGAIILKWILER